MLKRLLKSPGGCSQGLTVPKMLSELLLDPLSVHPPSHASLSSKAECSDYADWCAFVFCAEIWKGGCHPGVQVASLQEQDMRSEVHVQAGWQLSRYFSRNFALYLRSRLSFSLASWGSLCCLAGWCRAIPEGAPHVGSGCRQAPDTFHVGDFVG